MGKPIPTLHAEHIAGTNPENIVLEVEMVLCTPTKNTCLYIQDFDSKFYITTRSLKHMYDKRPAAEYDKVCEHMHSVVKYPDHIYVDKPGKRGNYCFRKRIDGIDYLVVVEHNKEIKKLSCVTGFFLRKESYLNNYDSLMSWEGGTPPS